MYTAVPPFVEYRFEKKYTHSTGNTRALMVSVRDLHKLIKSRKQTVWDYKSDQGF